jgi:CHAT domain-containing protein/tetratricopeptide (TPR) repeat protein
MITAPAARAAARATASLTLVAASLAAPEARASVLFQARTFADCDRHLGEQRLSHTCYQVLARRDRSWAEGVRHLEGRRALSPEDGLTTLGLGLLYSDARDPRAEDTLRAACVLLEKAGDRESEGFGRLSLFFMLANEARFEEAETELRRASDLADLASSDFLRRYVEYHSGLNAFLQLDLSEAMSRFKKLEPMISADGATVLNGWLLDALGSVAFRIGRYDEALEYHKRAAEIQRALGDDYTAAVSLWNMLLDFGYSTGGTDRPRDQEKAYAEEVARVARASGNLQVLADMQLHDAQEAGTPIPERLRLLEEALAGFRAVGDEAQSGYASRYRAYLIGSTYPERRTEAERLLRDGAERARRAGLTEQVARGRLQLATLYMNWGERAKAIEEWTGVLDTIEKLRDQQTDQRIRAGFQSTWAFIYYRVAGYLLGPPGPGASPEDLDAALGVIERMRARVLLDSLDRAGAPTGGLPSELQRRRAEVLASIARTQRGLLSSILGERERTERLAVLDTLEAQEMSLREELARKDPSFASLRAPALPSVKEIQAALGEDEALVSFQMDVDGRKPGWAVILSRGETRTYALPGRVSLAGKVPLFLGLLERRDGSEAEGAARLFEDLLKPGIDAIPPEVRRLVIVPDGPLYDLPFDALRAEPAGEPLAARYEIALAPSCATWVRWRRAARATAPRPVLALADPSLDGGAALPASYRAGTLASGLRLGHLPRAREEARAMVRSLGGGSRAVVGADATERFMKTADLPEFRVLHLAAHSIVDGGHPERSAVLLAAGSDEEDGLLQIREIVNLDLKGRLVILSSCSSASGPIVEGEGVMGLARAFFQAGAVAVVGSLLPLQDDEAARFVDDVAAHLSDGSSVASALQGARRDRMAGGAPARAWAGFVVLGDGSFVPLPSGVRKGRSWGFFTVPGTGAALIVAIALLARRRRTRRSSPAGG